MLAQDTKTEKPHTSFFGFLCCLRGTESLFVCARYIFLFLPLLPVRLINQEVVAGSVYAGCFSKRKESEAVCMPQTKSLRSDCFAAALRGEQEGFAILFKAFFGGKHLR